MSIRIRKGDLIIEVSNVAQATAIIDHLLRPAEKVVVKKVVASPQEAVLNTYKSMGYRIFERVALGDKDVVYVFPSGTTHKYRKEYIAKYIKMFVELGRSIKKLREELRGKVNETVMYDVTCIIRTLDKYGVIDELIKEMGITKNKGKPLFKFPRSKADMMRLEREAHEDLYK